MKNKTLTYVLLVVVGLIWYQVFYRVSDNLFGEQELPPDPVQPGAAQFVMERDTFLLKADYRDPFVEDKKPVISMEEVPPMRQAPPPVKAVKPKTPWPGITYYGLVRRTSSQDPLAILKVDGLQLMLRRNEEMFNEYILKEIWRDSILVVFKKERKMFYRN